MQYFLLAACIGIKPGIILWIVTIYLIRLKTAPIPETYTTIPNAKFMFTGADTVNARGSSATDPGVYTFVENVQGAYAMVKYYISDRFDVIAGLRGEHTDQAYYSNLPVTFPGKTATITYTDYLPSVNIKYALTDEQALRASYYKSILRPTFADLIPYPDGTADETYFHIGNPYLQHTVVNNFDLRYEFFPGVFDEFMLGGFYKQLINPIETVLEQGPGGATLYLIHQQILEMPRITALNS